MKTKIKFEPFLLEDEEQNIKNFIKELEKNPEQEYNESGGFGVKIDENLSDGSVIYDVYRIIGTIHMKNKKAKLR